MGERIRDICNAGLQAVVALVLGLFELIAELKRENEALRDKVASLEKDSTNSSKPPSSDGLKKKHGSPKRGSSGRRPGGQKGHVGNTRAPVPPQQVSRTVPYRPTDCERCRRHFDGTEHSEVVERRQTSGMPKIEPTVTEHHFYAVACPCGHQTRLPVPNGVMSGIDEDLQALIAYLTGEARLSRRTLQKVLAEVFGTPISVGALQNRLEDTSEALEPTCRQLEDALAREPVINIDETSYPHNRQLPWLWAFVAKAFVYFTIAASRGSKVLRAVLGNTYDGIIICDRFSAYIKYHKDRACGLIQFCWAHIIRQAKGLPPVCACGCGELFSRLARARIGAVFRLWHTFKRGQLSRQQLIEKAQAPIGRLRTLLEDNLDSSSRQVRTFCNGQLGKWDSLFTFIYHEGVEPTNNLAERLIRPGVQSRKISYCTRSENGQLLRARLLTVLETCRMQGRNPLQFLRAAIHAKRHGHPFVSLLPFEAEKQQQSVA